VRVGVYLKKNLSFRQTGEIYLSLFPRHYIIHTTCVIFASFHQGKEEHTMCDLRSFRISSAKISNKAHPVRPELVEGSKDERVGLSM